MNRFRRYVYMLSVLPMLCMPLATASALPDVAMTSVEGADQQVAPIVLARNEHRGHHHGRGKCERHCDRKYWAKVRECERRGERHCQKRAKRFYRHCMDRCAW
ncbi:MAG: hypothetical protein H7836_03980 [Magnetococcus sp. YQC-3]